MGRRPAQYLHRLQSRAPAEVRRGRHPPQGLRNDESARTSRPVNQDHTTAVIRDRWRRYGAFAASVVERTRRGASYNPLSERTIQNPYPVYARLRKHSPVHRSFILGSWILSRYHDVLAVARDHKRFSNDPRWRNATASVLPPAPDDYSILLVDPPEHTRLRKVAARAFTQPKLMALAPTIEALANDVVERAVERGEVEWIGDVAQPMAMRVMLRMLGIAGEEETRWHRWSAERARLLEMIATRAERKTAHITGESMTGYFRERLAERACGEADDAISLLAREAVRGEFINTAEAADMLGVIMIAGNETTANLIGNGLWALMRHPDQMEQLRDEPERARDAINEILRYDSPVQTDFRIAKSDAVVGAKTIRSGEGVILLTGSAKPRRGGVQRVLPARHRPQGAQARSVRAWGAPVHRRRARTHGNRRRHRGRRRANRANDACGATAALPAFDGGSRSREPRGTYRATTARCACMRDGSVFPCARISPIRVGSRESASFRASSRGEACRTSTNGSECRRSSTRRAPRPG